MPTLPEFCTTKFAPVCRMFPPEIVRPEAEERPPEVEMEIPPSNVEVAVEEELIPPPAWRSLATERVLANVEEAAAERFCVAMEEEAESVPTFKFLEKVEEADETRPPDGSIEKRVEEAESVTMKGLPVCPVWSLRVKRLAVVEVAPMVRTERTSGVEVPMPTLSVAAVSRTVVPSSVKPALLPQVAQLKAPAPSVDK